MDLITKAKRYFGVTSNINKAGYINLDGTLLDFSGGNSKRMYDHRDIKSVFKKEDYVCNTAEVNCYGDNSSAMFSYMYLGNIRWSPESNGFDLEATKEPTEYQYKTILRILDTLFGRGDFYCRIDFTDNMKDKLAAWVEYEDDNFNPDRIIKDIKYFYRNGKLPNIRWDS